MIVLVLGGILYVCSQIVSPFGPTLACDGPYTLSSPRVESYEAP